MTPTQAERDRVRWAMGVAACTGWVVAAALFTRGIQEGDSGEFGLVAARGTLAHPPGFPLYATVIRALAALVPAEPVVTVAAFSAACHGVAMALLARLASNAARDAWVGLCVAWAWGLHRFALYAAADADVFAMHHVVILGLAALASRVMAGRARDHAEVMALGLAFGLAGGVHGMAIALAPLVLAAVALPPQGGLRRVLLLGACAVAGLGIFLVLPSSYARDPGLAFGRVETAGDLLAHMTRRHLAYPAADLPTHQAWDFLRQLATSFPVVVPALGWVTVRAWRARVKRRRGVAVGLVLIAHLGIYFSLRVPAVEDVGVAVSRTYPSGFAFALLLAASAFPLLRPAWRKPLGALVLLPALVSLPAAVRHADAAGDGWADAHARLSLEMAPRGALLVTRSDAASFGTLYLQNVDGVRTDVTVVVAGRLGAPWYRAHVRQHPWAAGLTEDDVASAQRLMRAAVEAGVPVVAEYGVPPPEGWSARPVGTVWRVYPPGAEPSQAEVAEALFRFCAALPASPGTPGPERVASALLRAGAFAHPFRILASVTGEPGRAAQLRAVADALEAGDAASARAACPGRD